MALPLLLVAGGGLLLLLGLAVYLLLFRGPRLGDDWPRVSCAVRERTGKWPDPPAPKRLKEISPAEYRTLCALCDTFIPSFVDDDAGIKRAAREYVEELLAHGAADAARREALVAELTSDMGFYKHGALDAGVPLRVADVIEAEVPAGAFWVWVWVTVE